MLLENVISFAGPPKVMSSELVLVWLNERVELHCSTTGTYQYMYIKAVAAILLINFKNLMLISTYGCLLAQKFLTMTVQAVRKQPIEDQTSTLNG